MRNSPTSVGSRAIDTRSHVRACCDHGQSRISSSFKSFTSGTSIEEDYREAARGPQAASGSSVHEEVFVQLVEDDDVLRADRVAAPAHEAHYLGALGVHLGVLRDDEARAEPLPVVRLQSL